MALQRIVTIVPVLKVVCLAIFALHFLDCYLNGIKKPVILSMRLIFAAINFTTCRERMGYTISELLFVLYYSIAAFVLILLSSGWKTIREEMDPHDLRIMICTSFCPS